MHDEALNIKSTRMPRRTAILLGFCTFMCWSTVCFFAKANVKGILSKCSRSVKNAPLAIMPDVERLKKDCRKYVQQPDTVLKLP